MEAKFRPEGGPGLQGLDTPAPAFRPKAQRSESDCHARRHVLSSSQAKAPLGPDGLRVGGAAVPGRLEVAGTEARPTGF